MVQGIRTLALATEINSENPIIGDWRLLNGDVVWLEAEDPEATAQSISRRLGTFLGEWFLDQKIGFPWFQKVFGKGRSHATIKSLMRTTILETQGVKAVTLVNYTIDAATRELDVAWTATFDDGKVYTSTDFDTPFVLRLAQ